MAVASIQSNTEQKKKLKEIGKHMNPNIDLKYGQIIDSLLAEYREKHGL